MEDQFSRSEILVGKEALERLHSAKAAVFGLGGVGGSAAEALVRAGIGSLDIIDGDKVTLTNLNRQVVALQSNLGKFKTEAAAARFRDINPGMRLREFPIFYLPETADRFDLSEYDYIIDAVDSVTAKIELVLNAQRCGTPIICAMGAGNKLGTAPFEVADIYKTTVCPLARVMRCELRKRGVKKLKVVYSKETPITPAMSGEGRVTGSMSFVPPVMGYVMAGEVIRDLTLLSVKKVE